MKKSSLRQFYNLSRKAGWRFEASQQFGTVVLIHSHAALRDGLRLNVLRYQNGPTARRDSLPKLHSDLPTTLMNSEGAVAWRKLKQLQSFASQIVGADSRRNGASEEKKKYKEKNTSNDYQK